MAERIHIGRQFYVIHPRAFCVIRVEVIAVRIGTVDVRQVFPEYKHVFGEEVFIVAKTNLYPLSEEAVRVAIHNARQARRRAAIFREADTGGECEALVLKWLAELSDERRATVLDLWRDTHGDAFFTEAGELKKSALAADDWKRLAVDLSFEICPDLAIPKE